MRYYRRRHQQLFVSPSSGVCTDTQHHKKRSCEPQHPLSWDIKVRPSGAPDRSVYENFTAETTDRVRTRATVENDSPCHSNLHQGYINHQNGANSQRQLNWGITTRYRGLILCKVKCHQQYNSSIDRWLETLLREGIYQWRWNLSNHLKECTTKRHQRC